VSNFYILDLKNLAKLRRRCIARATRGWIHTQVYYSWSTVTLQLHYFDLFWTCRISCCCMCYAAVGKFWLTHRVARSLCGSRTSSTKYEQTRNSANATTNVICPELHFYWRWKIKPRCRWTFLYLLLQSSVFLQQRNTDASFVCIIFIKVEYEVAVLNSDIAHVLTTQNRLPIFCILHRHSSLRNRVVRVKWVISTFCT